MVKSANRIDLRRIQKNLTFRFDFGIRPAALAECENVASVIHCPGGILF